jgi:hypothetical protein
MRHGVPLVFAEWLWDLLPSRQRTAARDPIGAPPATTPPPKSAAPNRLISRKQDQYDALVTEMKQRYGIRVRKWRSATTGCAWQVRYENGQVNQWIEAPYPRGPVSAAVFLHEVGHHVIGFNRYKPRCLEEYMAWQWALQAMQERAISVSPSVQRRVDASLRYAVDKARRRGLRALPAELVRYAH